MPDHTTLSRRAATLRVPRPRAGTGALQLLVDSTGLRLGGPGEWLVEKHGAKTRRSWRKLHLGVDAGTGRIEAVELTGNETDDGSRVGPLLDQVAAPVASFTGDGAYDREDVYGAVAERHPEAAVSCRRARTRCRAGQPRPRPPSATGTFSSSPSAVAWAGRRPPATTVALWRRRRSPATSG